MRSIQSFTNLLLFLLGPSYTIMIRSEHKHLIKVEFKESKDGEQSNDVLMQSLSVYTNKQIISYITEVLPAVLGGY